ncbi:MAG: hypothetical protein H5U40_15470, partial [Polyangiaceae bacterium]|nr:hypothetical protein [Polyangiaceae bacterium]
VTLIDDEGFRESLGLTRVGLAPRAGVRLGRVFWRFATRFLTGFDEVGLWSTAWFNDYPTYPTGYERLRLGPKKVLAMLERSEAAHN